MAQEFPENLTKWETVTRFLGLIKCDVYLFLLIIAIVMQGTTITQLAEDKMCLNQLQFPREYCLTLTSNHSRETSTQSILLHVNRLKSWQTAIDTVPSTIIVLFASFCLEKYPKYLKLFMLLPCCGCIIQACVHLANAFYFQITSWAILLAYLPSGMTGGLTLLITAFSTYVSWSTPTRFLVIRFAVVELVIKLGVLIGTYIGGHILAQSPWFQKQAENYLGVLLTSLSLLLVSFVYGLCVPLEGAPLTPENLDSLSHKQVARDVFKLSRIREMAEPLKAKREGNDRTKLICAIVAGQIVYMTVMGDEAIAYQFAQQVYGFSASKYSSMLTTLNAFPIFLTIAGPQILKMLNVRDTMIGVIGSLSIIAMNAIKGTITNPTGFALAYTAGGLNALASTANRAGITAIIEPRETAKVFAITNSFSSYLSIATSYIYTSVYGATMSTRPGLIYIIAALFMLFPLFNFSANYIIVGRANRKLKSKPKLAPTLDINGNPIEMVAQPSAKIQQRY